MGGEEFRSRPVLSLGSSRPCCYSFMQMHLQYRSQSSKCIVDTMSIEHLFSVSASRCKNCKCKSLRRMRLPQNLGTFKPIRSTLTNTCFSLPHKVSDTRISWISVRFVRSFSIQPDQPSTASWEAPGITGPCSLSAARVPLRTRLFTTHYAITLSDWKYTHGVVRLSSSVEFISSSRFTWIYVSE